MQLSRHEENKTTLSGNWNLETTTRLQLAWLNAIAMNHKLPDSIRFMDGMSGKKYRNLINNLVGSTPDARYLEVGSWAGSTACSAIWGNQVTATCIDNWSEFGGPKNAFMSNIRSSMNDKVKFTFIEKDFRQVDYNNIGKFNIYMFDGPHSEQDQYDGIVIAQPALDDTFTLIVDDWNFPQVRIGTDRAIRSLGLNVLADITIFSHLDNGHPAIAGQNSDWHNGYYIAVVSKGNV